MIKVTKIGKWNTVERLIFNLEKEAKRARYKALQRWGLKAESLAKNHIANQDFANGNGWAPLAAYTIRKKTDWGASLNTLEETGNYKESITSFVKDETALVGIRKGARAARGKMKLHVIAQIQEYGSMTLGIPARPLWQPVFTETMEWHLQNNNPARILLETLRKKYPA